ncbi:MAG: TrbC family F-type conjugative pilus assembly protein [Porticoccaceae bacterium]
MLGATLIALSVSASANAQSVKDIVNQSRDIMNNPETILGSDTFSAKPDPTKIQQQLLDAINEATEPQMKRGIEMLNGTAFDPGQVADLMQKREPVLDDKGLRYEIYASRSMKEEGLRQVFDLASANPSSVVIFQGIREDQKIGEGVRELHKIIRGIEPVPNTVIDPTKFRDKNITQVPTIIAYNADDKEVARAAGTANPKYLRNEISRDNLGDLGLVGTVYKITEPNLIDVMRKRVLEVDWRAKTKGAPQRYLNKLQFVDLPIAEESKVVRLEPINRLTKELRVPETDLVFPAGMTFNPLKYQSFRTFIIVFDATDPEQLSFAGRLADEQVESRPVSLISTKYQRESGFEWLGKVEQEIGFPIYLLKEDFAKTLAVTSVPSTVQAQGDELIITSYARSDWP